MAGMTLRKQEVDYFFSVPKEERDGDWETALVTRLKRYAKRIAWNSFKKYEGNKRDILDLEDFESLAYIGLINAIREYEPSNGKFCAFVSKCMQNEIRHSLLEKRGRDEFTLISFQEVEVIPIDGGISETVEDVNMEGFVEYVLDRFKDLLTPQEYYVLHEVFLRDEAKTEVAMGAELGVSRSYIQFIKRKGLEKIRRCMSTRAEDWDY